MLLAEDVKHRERNALRAACFRKEAPEHHAEAEDEADVAERAAEAAFNRPDDLVERHAARNGDADRNDDEGDEGVELESDCEEQKRRNADGNDE